ncbi:MAG: ribose import ATP-binding protein RbsA [Candidatus Roseilinea sp.]|nr:MAG: ribose import ATP-binding protein RbsA [Candidatus Roseilinea sp.]
MPVSQDKAPILEMRGISKRFDATQALNDVSLTLYPGEVHALLGENGAGKSTLIKIMTGIHQPDAGEILLDGHPIQIHNAMHAQSLGIVAIYQEPMIFPDLTVAENIFIGHAERNPFMRWRQMYRDARDILARLDVKLDVRAPARGLTLAAQQAVEIAKAISLNTRVLIMDEPTASLSAHEVEQLFKLVNTLRQQGVAILFISHRLDEVFAIADRVTIFRDGRWISTRPRGEVTSELAIREMVGREITDFFAKTPAIRRGERLLSVRNLSKAGVFSGISFDVYRGEVLGFAGLVGARRTDVGLALFGIEPADSGEIVFEGRPYVIRSPQQAVRLGIAYVTEDRRQLGLSLPQSITANITLPLLRRYAALFGWLDFKAEAETAERYKQQLSIRAPHVQIEVGKLSGGNQQKVMLAKWLNTAPKLLILDEPTRGIDVGAKAEVHHIINALAQQGIGIILISSDLPEVLGMSDRVLVMREGRQMGIFDRAEATQERVMAAAVGQALPEAPTSNRSEEAPA